jgi:hypothetical protein
MAVPPAEVKSLEQAMVTAVAAASVPRPIRIDERISTGFSRRMTGREYPPLGGAARRALL